MNTLVFSDTHLSHEFDKEQFDALATLIEKHDRVIINGDLWVYTDTTFDKFVNSEWNKLFPLLKEKNTVYIHGNHDRSQWADKRVEEFADEFTSYYKLETNKYNFHFRHGHDLTQFTKTLDVISDGLIFVTRTFRLRELSIKTQQRLVNKYGYPKSVGTHVLSNMMRNFAKSNYSGNDILVSGHCHIPEMSLEDNYINLGFFDFGIGYYLTIDKEGNPSAKDVKYRS